MILNNLISHANTGLTALAKLGGHVQQIKSEFQLMNDEQDQYP